MAINQQGAVFGTLFLMMVSIGVSSNALGVAAAGALFYICDKYWDGARTAARRRCGPGRRTGTTRW